MLISDGNIQRIDMSTGRRLGPKDADLSELQFIGVNSVARDILPNCVEFPLQFTIISPSEYI